MAKQSKVKSITFKNAWEPPQGGKLFIHDVEMENGDKSPTYLRAENPPEFKVGSEVTYDLVQNKIKNMASVEEKKQVAEIKKEAFSKSTAVNSVAMAKDLIIARIAAKDKTLKVNDAIQMSEEITAYAKMFNTLIKEIEESQDDMPLPND